MGRLAALLSLLCLFLPSWLGMAASVQPPPAAIPAPPIGREKSASTSPLDPANSGRPSFRITRNRDGLPQNAVNALAFDGKGYLWVGTQDGAARYDGRSWSVLNMPNRAVSNHVRVIMECDSGGLWFGSREGGLSCWKNEAWTHYDTKDGLPNNGIRSILETHATDGVSFLWAGTEAGLARFDGIRWTPVIVATGNPSPRINCLLETGAGTAESAIWAGTDSGLARLQFGVWTLYTGDAGLPDPVVNCLLERTLPTGERRLVAGTNSGLAEFRNGRWAPFALAGKAIRSVTETVSPSGVRSLWVGTATSLDRLTDEQWSNYNVRAGLPGHSINCLLPVTGPGGTRSLFVGTDSGLAEWENGTWLSFDQTNGLPSAMTFSFLETTGGDGASTLWIGTESGIARCDATAWSTITTADGLPNDRVLCMLETHNSSGESAVWAGTSGGLARFERGKWTTYTVKDGLPDNGIRCLLETSRPDGGKTLWAGTYGGLARFEDGQWSAFTTEDGLPHNGVLSLLETTSPTQGPTLWIGTYTGLARLENGRIRPESERSGFPMTGVRSLLLTGSRTLWVGTSGAGVVRANLDAENLAWVTIDETTAPALPNNVVYRVHADRKGRIYLFTNRGIARLTEREPTADNPAGYRLTTFTVDDGLPNNESNAGAAMVDSRGRIWAGTVAGAAVYDPELEVEDTQPKPLYVQNAMLVSTGAPLEPATRLDHDQNHVRFEYALLDFVREKDTRYQTHLVGLDARPSEWSPDFKKEYTALPRGEYVFRVWGRDAAGNITGPVDFPFTVKAAPWMTWWAFTLYVIALAGLLWLAAWLRLRALAQRNRVLESRISERTAEIGEKVRQLEISEQHALEEKQKAIEANRAKTQFLANMSHELRTPLNAIIGFIQLMQKDGNRSPDDRENLAIINRSSENLLALILDLLTVSRIEAGRIQQIDNPFDVRLLLQGIQEMFLLRSREKGVALNIEIDDALPRYVRSDEGRLRQVLIKLLSNAFKYTQRGRVTLRVRYENERLFVEVLDTGPGISEADQKRVFGAFVQGSSEEMYQEGAGIGLTISRSFVQLLGGDLYLKSVSGEGSTFYFDIPLPEASMTAPEGEHRRVAGLAPGQQVYRILAVDDKWENRALLGKMLSSAGFDVREAASGSEAVETWERWRPHLIWMDRRMAGMDGITATRAIRDKEHEGEHAVIIAVTTSEYDVNRDELLAAGCDDSISKPYRESEIFEKMAEHLGIRYLYQDRSAFIARDDIETTLDASRLAGIPETLLRDLRSALNEGDSERAMLLTERIAKDDERLARTLRSLLKGYRFDEIIEAIGEN